MEFLAFAGGTFFGFLLYALLLATGRKDNE